MADGRLNPADKLTEDLLVEILSRVPYKSLCRFKCVSKRWRGIISHPDHRKALPQYHLHDLAGFLYLSGDFKPGRFLSPTPAHKFTGVAVGTRPPVRPSLPFLPDCARFDLLDSCNGLLLCRRFQAFGSKVFDYVVCNPATEKWVALPGFFTKMQTARLGFDPAVSSHFHVFRFVENTDGQVKGVEIYSSKTGAWSHNDSRGLIFPTRIFRGSKSVFVNGFLHLLAAVDGGSESWVVAVDVEGTTWRVIPTPRTGNFPLGVDVRFIDLSQGRLYLARCYQHDEYKLSIWVLEDYDSEEHEDTEEYCDGQVWVLKHSVRCLNLFGLKQLRDQYHIVALHPQQNTIFLLYGYHKVLMSYEMDSGKVQFITDLGYDSKEPYLPYVTLYSKELADWN